MYESIYLYIYQSISLCFFIYSYFVSSFNIKFIDFLIISHLSISLISALSVFSSSRFFSSLRFSNCVFFFYYAVLIYFFLSPSICISLIYYFCFIVFVFSFFLAFFHTISDYAILITRTPSFTTVFCFPSIFFSLSPFHCIFSSCGFADSTFS